MPHKDSHACVVRPIFLLYPLALLTPTHFRSIKSITNVDWYQEHLNRLVVLARERSSLEVRIWLYGGAHTPSFLKLMPGLQTMSL